MVAMTEARTEVIMRVAVRCGQVIEHGKRKGQTCNNLLVLVDVDRWEETMTDAVAGFCERSDCRKPYNLGEYR